MEGYILGTHALALIPLPYLPQLQKAIPRNSTSDLSLKMLVALSIGLRLEFQILQAPPSILFKRAARKIQRQRGRRR
jgi:hypothetical protein